MKKVVKRKNKKRRLNFQKIFNLLSFTFLLSCVIFYGSRFIKLYLENNKTEESKLLGDIIKENNELNNVNNEYYYFTGEDPNNYLKYSNLLFRIIKVNKDKTVTAVLNNSITSLAAGSHKDFTSSYINMWLNSSDKEYTGILENNLNNPKDYLTFTNSCIDEVNDVKSVSCKNTLEDIYITTPSVYDYVNTDGQKGFMNNEEAFYLLNSNKDNDTWYIDSEGLIKESDGTDIIGIKPVITIKSNLDLVSGDGTKDNPYTIENDTNMLGAYISLGNDLWRVYNIEDNDLKLSLTNYLTIDNKQVEKIYSNNGYKHNDTVYGSLAYYLNNNYLNTLSYKNIIKESNYPNGIYSNVTNFDYTKVLSSTVPTKVATLSIGNIILNPTLTNYFTTTGLDKTSSNVYMFKNDFTMVTKPSTTSLNIVPTITISKDSITSGEGTKESPYEVK